MFLTPLETDNKQILRRGVYPEHAEGLLRMTLRQVPRAMGGKPTTPSFEGAHEGHEAHCASRAWFTF
jgi:hypothetical protein